MPRPGGRSISYYCRQAPGKSDHPRPYVVSERFITAWAVGEVASRWRVPAHTYDAPTPEAIAERMRELDAKRLRWAEMYADGTITRPERDKHLAEIRAEREGFTARDNARRILTFRNRPFDWNRDPGVVNVDLRALWEYIELGSDLRPVRAVWRSGTGWGPNDA